MSDSKKPKGIHIIQRLFGYVKPFRGAFILTALFTFVAASLSPLRPWLIQKTIDGYVTEKNFPGLLNMIYLMIGVLILESIIQFLQAYMANYLGQSIVKEIRTNLFRKLSHFKLKFYDQTPIGTLVTRVVSDIETIADVFSEGFLMIIADLLKVIIVLAVMLATDWKLTLISLTTLPILILSAYWFKNSVKKSFQEVRNQVAALNTFVQEHITGMSIVQMFNREDMEMKNFLNINEKHRNANIKAIWAYSVFFPVVELVSAISLALIVWWGAKNVITGYVTLGLLTAFIMYINMLFRPIRQLADNFNVLQMGMVSSERVFKLMDSEMELQHEGKIKMGTSEGNVSFKNVWFAYTEEDWVLKDFSLEVNKGEKLAVVGATGAGKTSLINILGRFYEYQKGNIYMDGNELREIDIDDIRKNIAIVTQDIFLFSDTVLNNITLHDPSVSLEQVIEAAKAVGAHEFIEKLPNSYEYNVRERGNSLSVGQRQLISFIRAYVQKPEILILDEATSSIDNESELLIQKATEKITEGRTSIIIAHRLTTIQNADKIVVMDKGKIVEIGTHSQLIAQNGYYKQLYELQFSDI